ncbi:MAG: YitT family protein [Bacilli bacterium]|nr:YitT family protein [Bacilli bacterium]
MIKKKYLRFKKQVENFLFDHYIIKTVLHYLFGFMVAAIAAVIFAFGFACFTTPAQDNGFVLASGGVSGISQIIALIVEVIRHEPVGGNLIQSVGYTLLNVPLLIFSFFKIGKRFTIFTLVNVVLSSVFISLFTNAGVGKMVAEFSFADGVKPLDPTIVRVLFAGMCTGLSSAFAYAAGISCGGIDIIAFYVGTRKSTQVGRYGIIINGVIVITYALVRCITENSFAYCVYSIFFSIIYLMLVGLIVDTINLRNKKIEMQIITNQEHMPEIIIANFPHSATIVKGKGAYSGNDKTMLFMVVSSSEVKKVVDIVKKVDEHAFITATPLKQVYGNFFIKPLE